MTKYAVPEPKIQTLPIDGKNEVFPVRRVYCIGRNYAAHAVEMGYDPEKEDPFFFQKNPDNLNVTGQFPYPPKSSDVHHEAELLVALKSGGVNIEYEDALSHVYGYALCLDMTRRDRQGEMKKAVDLGKSEKPSNIRRHVDLCT
jgi:fumarylpyruvate hydrolase